MSKNSKILVVLLFVSLSLGFYIIFSINKIEISEDTQVNVVSRPKVDMEKVKRNYSGDLNKLVLEIKSSINNPNLKATGSAFSLENLKKEIENLKSPNISYKNIHLNLILALNNLETYLETGDDLDRQKSLGFLAKAEKDLNQIIKKEENGI